jgi:hypothetical protein
VDDVSALLVFCFVLTEIGYMNQGYKIGCKALNVCNQRVRGFRKHKSWF